MTESDPDRDSMMADDEGSVVLTRSAERLDIDTQWFVAGRMRLRRVVSTETRTVQVEVRREELVVDTDDIPSAGDTMTGIDTAGETIAGDAVAGDAEPAAPYVLYLREEVPEITTVVQPYEKVTVTTSVGTSAQRISETLGHEEITVDTAAAETHDAR